MANKTKTRRSPTDPGGNRKENPGAAQGFGTTPNHPEIPNPCSKTNPYLRDKRSVRQDGPHVAQNTSRAAPQRGRPSNARRIRKHGRRYMYTSVNALYLLAYATKMRACGGATHETPHRGKLEAGIDIDPQTRERRAEQTARRSSEKRLTKGRCDNARALSTAHSRKLVRLGN